MNQDEGSSPKKENLFSELEASYQIIMDSLIALRHYINYSTGQLHDIINRLEQVKKNKSTIHFTGMGCSKLVGQIIGELFLDRGYNVSFIGESFSVPVGDKDVVLAFSGSGRTRTTIDNIRSAVLRDIEVIGITASPRSELARFSDYCIKFDWCKRKPGQMADYGKKRILGKSPHLTPMGTLFELNALVFGIAVVISLEEPTPLGTFLSFSKKIIDDLENTWFYIITNEKTRQGLLNFKNNIIECTSKEHNFFSYGTGTSRYVSRLIGMRTLHIGVNIPPLSSWRFRKRGDTVLIIAEDGNNSKVKDQMNEGREMGLKTTLITRLKGKKEETTTDTVYLICNDEFDYTLANGKKYSPSFDIIASILLDSLLAQIAFDLEIAEESMVERHANVE